MAIRASGIETYLYLTGIAPPRPVQLTQHSTLLPANRDHLPDLMGNSPPTDKLAVAFLFLPRTCSQLHITGASAKDTAANAWNAQWQCILLSALFDRDVVANIQADVPFEKLADGGDFNVTNFALRGINSSPDIHLTEADAVWLEKYLAIAFSMLDMPAFETAAHSLATCRWHMHGRSKLALIWAGIESVFSIESELVFRVSLYIARFLADDDREQREKIFRQTKELYKVRSAAVHGSKLKGDIESAVSESSCLLRRLLRRCIENGALPDIQSLAP